MGAGLRGSTGDYGLMATVNKSKLLVLSGGTIPVNGVSPADLALLEQEVDGKQPAGDYADGAEVRSMTAKELDTLDLLIGSMDQERRRLWPETERETGGPSDFSSEMQEAAFERLGRRLARAMTMPGVLDAVVDENGLQTVLAAREKDGAFTEFAASLVRLSLAEAGQRMTDMTRLVGWGSSTIEYLAPQLRPLATSLGMTYHDGGDAGVLSRTTLAQMGVAPAKVSFPGGVVPSNGTVDVTVGNVGLNTSTKPWRGVLRGTGIEGTLSCSSTSWTFQRHGSGPQMPVDADIDFLPIAGMTEQYSLPIINIGKNDLTSGIAATTVFERTVQAIDWLPTGNRRFLVMGHFVDTDTAASDPERQRIYDVNKALADVYGQKFIDLHTYITGSQIWTHTGITPTQADLDQQALGNKPPSLSRDPLHLNDAANQAVVDRLVRPRLVTLGWI